MLFWIAVGAVLIVAEAAITVMLVRLSTETGERSSTILTMLHASHGFLTKS